MGGATLTRSRWKIFHSKCYMRNLNGFTCILLRSEFLSAQKTCVQSVIFHPRFIERLWWTFSISCESATRKVTEFVSLNVSYALRKLRYRWMCKALDTLCEQDIYNDFTSFTRIFTISFPKLSCLHFDSTYLTVLLSDWRVVDWLNC